MIGRADFWMALATAAGLHVAAFTVWSPLDGGAGSGSGGEATVNVAAVDPALQRLVETWTTPPHVANEPEALARPEAEDSPAPPRADMAVMSAMNAPRLPLPLRAEPAPERASAPERHAAPEASSLDLQLARIKPRDDAPRTPSPLEEMAAPSVPKLDTKPPLSQALAQAPKPEPRPSRPAMAQRVALGSGGGATAGLATTDAARQAKADLRAADQARWAAQIQRRIAQYQSYPRGARASGRVRVSMVIMRNGALGNVSVARSSGASRLDQAALKAVKRAAPFPPAPESLTEGSYRVAQWISFERR